ncbi:MAG TPA: hypothetical protein VHO46_01210 [Bacteroidales bacterium]|nr:hypothetical protein [Bacteroidales bacterium]
MNFILSIDTEADNQWDHGRGLTTENIRFVPRFQELCNKYQIKPTYLVTSEVCEDSFAREIFCEYIENDEAEIGAHLHSWTTPPFMNRDGYRYNDRNHAFASELPDDLLFNKLRYLTDQISTSFGRRPTSFRSGRYGFNESVAKTLIANEYVVDSSITPYIDWSSLKGIPGLKGGPDFRESRPFPYTYTHNGSTLLEIPVTVVPTKFPLNKDNRFTGFYFNNVNKNFILRSIRSMFFRYQPLWLRPFPWMSLQLLDEVIKEAMNLKLPYIVMIFHSSELMPNCSIYRADSEAVEKLYELLEGFFALLTFYKVHSVSLTEAAHRYELVTGTELSLRYV